MIYPDMPIAPNIIWLIAFLVAVAAGIILLTIYGAHKKYDTERSQALVSLILPVVMAANVVTAGALVYGGIVYDLLVQGAIVTALEDKGYENVDLDGDYFTALDGDNQVTAGLTLNENGSYSINIFMSGPTTLED